MSSSYSHHLMMFLSESTFHTSVRLTFIFTVGVICTRMILPWCWFKWFLKKICNDLNSLFHLPWFPFWPYLQSDAVGKMSDQVLTDLLQTYVLLARVSWMTMDVGQNLGFSTYKMRDLGPSHVSRAFQIEYISFGGWRKYNWAQEKMVTFCWMLPLSYKVSSNLRCGFKTQALEPSRPGFESWSWHFTSPLP